MESNISEASFLSSILASEHNHTSRNRLRFTIVSFVKQQVLLQSRTGANHSFLPRKNMFALAIYLLNHYAYIVRFNTQLLIYTYCRCVRQDEEVVVSNQEIGGRKPLQVLEKIRENLEKLNDKIEVMIELQKHGNKDMQMPLSDAPLDVMTLLSMPDHLRKTAMTLCRMGRATADEISGQTKRARAVESAYLNQLVIMGYLKKERNGRKAYFFVDRENQG
jgi:hypothetical protein